MEEREKQAEEVVVKDNFIANNIQFETSSAKLKQESIEEIDKIVSYMLVNEEVKLDISGHTDNQGRADANQLLSEKRAKAVYNYMISKGIAASRLSYAGYGQTKPVASNDSTTGRQQNRRVELKIQD